MNKFCVGAFYTDATPYHYIWQDYLLKSCEKFRIKNHVFAAPNYGSWHRNVAEKPRIIGEMLDLLTIDEECLVFLDADATIEQYPKLFEEIPSKYDIAYHTLNWNTWYGYDNKPATMELLSGTMFFRNRKKVKEMCFEWYKEAKKTNKWEQKVLAEIIGKYNLKTYPLPLEYCYPISRPKGKEPLVKLDPVILHHQKSREFKRKKL